MGLKINEPWSTVVITNINYTAQQAEAFGAQHWVYTFKTI